MPFGEILRVKISLGGRGGLGNVEKVLLLAIGDILGSALGSLFCRLDFRKKLMHMGLWERLFVIARIQTARIIKNHQFTGTVKKIVRRY